MSYEVILRKLKSKINEIRQRISESVSYRKYKPLLLCMVQLLMTMGASGVVMLIPPKAELTIVIDSICGGAPSTCKAEVMLISRPVPAYLKKETSKIE